MTRPQNSLSPSLPSNSRSAASRCSMSNFAAFWDDSSAVRRDAADSAAIRALSLAFLAFASAAAASSSGSSVVAKSAHLNAFRSESPMVPPPAPSAASSSAGARCRTSSMSSISRGFSPPAAAGPGRAGPAAAPSEAPAEPGGAATPSTAPDLNNCSAPNRRMADSSSFRNAAGFGTAADASPSPRSTP